MSRPLTVAALGAAALAAAAIARRRLQAQPAGPAATAGAGSRTEPEESSEGREWSCRCGQEYVVSGVDRHRVYWPAGGSPDEALLDLRCVKCGEPLPATREVTAA
jgi:hypothetical protein